jgi:hypothetical protein
MPYKEHGGGITYVVCNISNILNAEGTRQRVIRKKVEIEERLSSSRNKRGERWRTRGRGTLRGIVRVRGRGRGRQTGRKRKTKRKALVTVLQIGSTNTNRKKELRKVEKEEVEVG